MPHGALEKDTNWQGKRLQTRPPTHKQFCKLSSRSIAVSRGNLCGVSQYRQDAPVRTWKWSLSDTLWRKVKDVEVNDKMLLYKLMELS